MELQTGLCAVRSWQWSDRDSLVKHGNNRKNWINVLDRFPYPYRKEDVKRISAEIGYWLGEKFWGKEITTAALRAVTR